MPSMTILAEPTIEAVIFDLGGVLIEFDFDRANQRTAKIVNLPPQEVRRRILTCDAFFKYECGQVSDREFHACVEQALQHAVPYETFHELWNHIFIGEIGPTVTLVSQLRDMGLKIGILSNTNAIHFEYLRKTMRVLNELDHVYASHEIGCRKPHESSYRHVLAKMGVPAQRSVFVDDLAENIAAAKAVGMHGVHATDPQAVRRGLEALGVKIPAISGIKDTP
jgi:glucose-1-phosphatase